MEYILFDLQFFPPNQGRYSVAVNCPLVQGDATGDFISPAADPEYATRYAHLQALDTDEPLLVALGRQLYSALFQGQIRDAYTTARGQLKEDQGLRLRFNFDPRQVPEIAALPWEFLCDDEDQPLVLDNTPIVRYLPRFTPPPTIVTPHPLKILLSAAVTDPKSDVARELKVVRETLAALEQAGAVEVAVEEHLTIERLEARLREGFHLWHFIGHGKLSADGTSGQLVFEDADGEAAAYSAGDLKIVFNDVRDWKQRQRDPALRGPNLQVVILDACNSAKLATRPYGSIAPALMLENVGVVVAMQFGSPQENTRPFAEKFYQALSEGEPLDACVMRGRRAVVRATRLRNPDWGIPTVYTRAPDARLFLPGDTAAEQPATKLASTAQPPANNPAGGITVSVGNNNVLSDSPISVSAGGAAQPSSREGAENNSYQERADDLGQELAGLRQKLRILQLKKAKGQLTLGDTIELDDSQKEFDAKREALLLVRQERLAQLERRAAQPGRASDSALAADLADMRAIVVEETLAVRQRELEKQKDSMRFQPNDHKRAEVQQKIDALQAEITDLKRQRDS